MRLQAIQDTFANAGFSDAVVPCVLERVTFSHSEQELKQVPFKREFDRFCAYLRTLEEHKGSQFHNIEEIHDVATTLQGIVEFNRTIQDAYPLLEPVLADRSITALVTVSDVLGIRIKEYLRQKGMRIPRDLSIVGFDDSHFAYKYGVSSYNFCFPDIARFALGYILNPRRAFSPGAGRKIECEGILMERASSGPARKR
jgi:DNA-binding LacI/PurR family transcriptional regulator